MIRVAIITFLIFGNTTVINIYSQKIINTSESKLVYKEGKLIEVPAKVGGRSENYIWHESVKIKIDSTIQWVKSNGLIQKLPDELSLFVTPIKQNDITYDPGFYTISAYVDHNPYYPDSLLDYNCGNHTYDLAGGFNHTGTDYFAWPFPWERMENNKIEVVAASPGLIINKIDGNFDKNCFENEDPWNAVYLLHTDGIISIYGHMKKNSLTEKNIGDFVEAGEYLGIIGSSGSSLSPHLHFEVLDSLYNTIDPFDGPCNSTITSSYWAEQEPYMESGVNNITTNYKLPEFPECPEPEISHEKDQFNMNDTIFLLSYFRNMFLDDTVTITILRPDSTLWDTWNWISPWDFYNACYLYFFIIPQNDQNGNWLYKLTYKGKVSEKYFTLIDSQGTGNNSNESGIEIWPNPASTNVQVSLNNSTFSDICLYNSEGKEIYKEKIKKISGRQT